MKRALLVFGLVFVLSVSFLPAQGRDNPAFGIFINNFSAREYAAGQVTRAELDLIIQAGLRTSSAGNRQPWHFTVVQTEALAKQILPAASEGNVLIVISGPGTNGSVILDCALATQSMYLAAQALGLGSRIYTGPINNINSNFKTQLGLPADHNAVALVRIGRLPPGVDAVSSASSRNSVEQKVTYK